MNREASAAAVNIRYLEQGIELIRRLDDDLYADCPVNPFPGGVGAQFRHCIDFYDCFLAALAQDRIDYSERSRDARLESDRRFAEQKLRELIDALSALDVAAAERELLVRSEESADGNAPLGWSRSTVQRELEFLVSHTIHHYALIVILLHVNGFEVPEDLKGFGVAPSTLRHWRNSGPVAR